GVRRPRRTEGGATMSATVSNPSTAKGLPGHTMGRFRSLVVAVDLTAISDRVLARGALLPLTDGARLTLLHVVPESLPVPHRRRAQRDARKALAAEARHLAKSLPARVRSEK